MFLRSNLAGIAWALLILVLCGMPGEEVPDSSFLDVPFLDKAVHAFLFLVLAFLLSTGFKRQFSISLLQSWSATGSLVISLLYGLLIEGMQYAFISERSMEGGDILANAVGAGLGIACFHGVYRKASA